MTRVIIICEGSTERDFVKKIISGIPLAEAIGLREIREKCPLFDAWISWLENPS